MKTIFLKKNINAINFAWNLMISIELQNKNYEYYYILFKLNKKVNRRYLTNQNINKYYVFNYEYIG